MAKAQKFLLVASFHLRMICCCNTRWQPFNGCFWLEAVNRDTVTDDILPEYEGKHGHLIWSQIFCIWVLILK